MVPIFQEIIILLDFMNRLSLFFHLYDSQVLTCEDFPEQLANNCIHNSAPKVKMQYFNGNT